MKKEGPILFCGYNTSAQAALKQMQDDIESRGIIIVSKKEVPVSPGVTHLSLDYLNIENLKSRKVGLHNCSVCVIFAEFTGDESSQTVDMHTVLTVYNIKKEHPEAHVIAEILDRENTTIIHDFHCDDIIFKETIDYNLITSCILHPHISPIIYDLLTVRGKKLKQRSPAEAGVAGDGATFKEVRLKGLEQDVTYLGYISGEGKAELMPSNDTTIRKDYRLVYIE